MHNAHFARPKIPVTWRLVPLQASLVLLVLLGGCSAAVTERDLARPDFQSFSATTITQAEILQKYGEPFSSGQILQHDQTVLAIRYSRMSGDWRSRVRYIKRCVFYFVGDKYLGYSFLSGYPEEQVNFDEKKIPQIIKGKTTQSEVVALFGQPRAMMRYPATPEKSTVEGDSLLDYGYHLITADNGWFDNKELRILFDASGVAKDIVFESSKRNGKNARDDSASGL